MGFRIAQVADLARQSQFTPTEQRARQIVAAEQLLLEIDPAKAYPFDFILFRITGYHAKRVGAGAIDDDGFTGHLLTGVALQHDLGELIEQISDGMNLCVAASAEPVLTTRQVCQRFNVSEKSIQRWRRRGLAARRMIFDDGQKHVAFLAGSVERFFAGHRDGAADAASFSPVSPDERRRITDRARRLAAGGCTVEAVCHRIGRKLNRSPLTIARVLNQIGDPTILAGAATPLDAAECEQIIRAFEGGAKLACLAAKFNRPRCAIYRVLLERRLELLGRCNVRVIDDPLYHQPDAAAAISDIASAEPLAPPAQPLEHRPPRDVPPYLQSLYQTPLLSPARERALFLELHFHRFQFVSLRRKLEGRRVRWRDLELLHSHLGRSAAVKNRILAANLRLVVSIARKHVRPDVTLMDLVSDGNIALMRCVDSFDIHRGNRFSTYATLAVMKEFARAGTRRQRHRSVALAVDVPDVRGGDRGRRCDERDEVRALLSQLDERERMVLRARFGLSDDRVRRPESFDEIAQRLGVTRQCVRQIEYKALARLRGEEK